MDHPYPDHAYLERDDETNEKRWYSTRKMTTKGMGVRYIHEDRAAEDIEAAVEAAVKAEREAVYRELLSDDYDMNSSMLMTAGKIPLERENGGLEYPAIKVFREMLKTAAKVRGINL